MCMCMCVRILGPCSQTLPTASCQTIKHSPLYAQLAPCFVYLVGSGGTLYAGLDDDGRVVGLPLTRHMRDRLRLMVDRCLRTAISPRVPAGLVHLAFVPVTGGAPAWRVSAAPPCSHCSALHSLTTLTRHPQEPVHCRSCCLCQHALHGRELCRRCQCCSSCCLVVRHPQSLRRHSEQHVVRAPPCIGGGSHYLRSAASLV